MALTQTWVLQGTTPTTIGATDHIHFCSTDTALSAITVGVSNAYTKVLAADHTTDSSSGNTPKNVAYVAAGTCSKDRAATSNVADCTTAEATLKITIAYDSAITLSAVTFFAYDGTTTATAPTNMNCYAFQAGGVDAAWTTVNGSGAAMAVDGATFLNSATTHDAYIATSMSPTAVGIQGSNAFRIEFTYQ